MKNQTILTPYFLDEYRSGLEKLVELSGSDVIKGQSGMDSSSSDRKEKQRRMSSIHEKLAQRVEASLKQGSRPVSLAGDCCATLGVLAGLHRAGIEPTLIWLDAHGDFNTWETTPSGFLGGMPLAMAVGRGDQQMVKALGLRPLPEERVILCDARNLDPGEREAVADSGMNHVREASTLLDRIPRNQPMYLHFDTDFINPQDAPAMSYRTEGGPRAAEVRQIFQRLAEDYKIAAVSMTIWDQELDADGRTGKVCMDLLDTIIRL